MSMEMLTIIGGVLFAALIVFSAIALVGGDI